MEEKKEVEGERGRRRGRGKGGEKEREGGEEVREEEKGDEEGEKEERWGLGEEDVLEEERRGILTYLVKFLDIFQVYLSLLH